MKVELPRFETWEELNEELASFLSLPRQISSQISIRAYRSLSSAAYEICEGASHFFSHKRSMGIVKGNTPVLIPLLSGLYREGYQVQSVGLGALAELSVKDWVEGLKKDTNFVLYASDHPVTGELFHWEELDALLNERKIFSIRISHSDWMRKTSEGDWRESLRRIKPYSIYVLGADQHLALAICGEKVKNSPIVTQTLYWDVAQEVKRMESVVDHFCECPPDVLRFEGKLSHGWEKLTTSPQRLFDRSLVYNKEINGEFILNKLKKFGHITTSNLGHWNSPLSFFQWWETVPEPDILRGMLILDARILSSSPDFAESLLLMGKEVAF